MEILITSKAQLLCCVALYGVILVSVLVLCSDVDGVYAGSGDVIVWQTMGRTLHHQANTLIRIPKPRKVIDIAQH